MTRSRIHYALVLGGCCLLTALVTRWFVLTGIEPDCDGVADFSRLKGDLVEFVETHQFTDGEPVNGDRLPARLRSRGITNVYRNGRFVYFVLPSRSILPDDATQEFIWQFDRHEESIEEILRTTKRKTYHIQHLASAPGWYYWLHS